MEGGGEAGTRGAVTGTGRETEGVSPRGDDAQAEVGVVEPPTYKVGAVGRGLGSGGRKRGGERGAWELFKMEQRVGEMAKRVAHTGGTRVYDVDGRTAVVGEGGAEVKSPLAMGSPRGAVVGGVVGNDELAGGVEWVGGEVDGGAEKTSIGREGRVGKPGTKVVEGQLGMGEEEVPEVRGEVDVDGSKDGNEVVFERAYSTFSRVSTVVVGGNILDTGGGGKRLEESGEEGGGLVVRDNVGNGMAVGGEEGEGGAESTDVGGGGAGGLWLGVDVSTVRGHEYVLVPAPGRHGEPTREVSGQPLGSSD